MCHCQSKYLISLENFNFRIQLRTALDQTKFPVINLNGYSTNYQLIVRNGGELAGQMFQEF